MMNKEISTMARIFVTTGYDVKSRSERLFWYENLPPDEKPIRSKIGVGSIQNAE
jgi:hypothetical protein